MAERLVKNMNAWNPAPDWLLNRLEASNQSRGRDGAVGPVRYFVFRFGGDLNRGRLVEARKAHPDRYALLLGTVDIHRIARKAATR